MLNRKLIASGLMVVDEGLIHVSLADRISVPTQRTMTDAGQMHVPCRFARTGEQLYTAGQLGLVDEDPNKIITVLRDEADVFAQDSMDSFRSSPLTIGHPKDADGKAIAVSAENAKDLQVGMLEGMPTRDEDTLSGVLILTTDEAIAAIEADQELSAGYTCDIEEVDGKFYQRNIRANHIAIVNKGRAGSSCRISDEALVIQDADIKLRLTDAEAELITVKAELADAKVLADTQKQLVDEFKVNAEEAEVAVAAMKVELADAKLAASQGVIERCEVIENARLIADMRDLGDKSVDEIKRMVVEDQNPDKDYKSKSVAFMDAMFEILVDASKGETPMSKLLKQQETHVTIDAKPVDKVLEARKKMVQRQANQSK